MSVKNIMLLRHTGSSPTAQIIWLLAIVIITVMTFLFSGDLGTSRTLKLLLIGLMGSTVLALGTRVRLVLTRWLIQMIFLIFVIAYVAQYPAYLMLTSGAMNDSLGATLFSPFSQGASDLTLDRALFTVLAGFTGLALATLAIRLLESRKKTPIYTVLIRSRKNVELIIFNTGVIVFLLSSIPRYVFSLHNPELATPLPAKLGGLINLLNSQVSIYLMAVGLVLLALKGEHKKARSCGYKFLLIAALQYGLFLSKMSIFIPLAIIYFIDRLYGISILSKRFQLLLVGALLILYPFFNIYRSLRNYELVSAFDFWAAVKFGIELSESSDLENMFLAGLGAFWGRIVGLEPLLILLEYFQNHSLNLFDYLFSDFDLDNYLTYSVLDFDGPMGFSPGFLGRLVVFGVSPVFVVCSVALWVLFCHSILKTMTASKNKLIMALVPSVFIQLVLSSMGGPRLFNVLTSGFSFCATWLICLGIFALYRKSRGVGHENVINTTTASSLRS